MAGQDNWENEARDEKGRWTSGGGGRGADYPALRDGVGAALAGMPMPVRDRLDVMAGRIDRDSRGDVGGALAAGERANGASVLADTLTQVSMFGKGNFGQASPAVVAALRGIAVGLQAGHTAETRAVAVAQLQGLLGGRGTAGSLEVAMQEVQRVKQANIKELARVLQNEAESPTDQPIREAVGHTVLNRMQRNETNLVADVSGRYSKGTRPTGPETHALAIRLLNGDLPDNTGGATHFYQPYVMAHPTPVQTDKDGRYLTGNPPKGYEYVPGVVTKGVDRKGVPAFSVRPDWADGMQPKAVSGITDSLGKFFIAPGSRHVR
jgi:hypothetical protein